MLLRHGGENQTLPTFFIIFTTKCDFKGLSTMRQAYIIIYDFSIN